MLWLAIAVLSLAAAALLLRPLLGRVAAPASRAAHDVEVYRHQLGEVERDRARGLLSDEDAASARLELERRMLRAAGDDKAEGAAKGKKRRAAKAPKPGPARLAVVALVPLGALALYLYLGTPVPPDMPGQAAGQPGQKWHKEAVAAAEARVAALQRELAAAPEDGPGWIRLARSLRQLGRWGEAADAFRRALDLGQGGSALLADYGEALLLAADGVVPPPARRAFEEALATEPENPRARYYLGAAELQAGDVEGALRRWLALEAEAPPEAPWLATLRQQIAAAAEQNGLDLAALRQQAGLPPGKDEDPAGGAPGPGAPGPSAEDVEAAGQMSADERSEMIRTMVERLAARLEESPDDLEGWKRLARARQVLGEPDKAAQAFARAARLDPDNPELLMDYGQALLKADGGETPGKPLPIDFVGVMRRLLDLDEANTVALWYLGVAEMQAGRQVAAKGYWQRLLAEIPPEAPQRAEIQKRIQEIEAAQQN